MAAAKLFAASFICRSHGPITVPFRSNFRFRAISRHVSSSHFRKAASVSASPPAPAPTPAVHPWPEWDLLVEKLRSKGYFGRPQGHVSSATSGSDVDADALAVEGSALASDLSVLDVNLLRNGVIKFGRDRFDLIGSLPKDDIRTIVEYGCPSPIGNRKAINAAKRLRSFLKINEGDVCAGCKQRESCDRAHRPSNDDLARTLDIVLVLVAYAVDPTCITGGENSLDDKVQESVRKLLSELIKLSDTSVDPSIPMPSFNSSTPKAPLSHEVVENTKESGGKTGIEMKKGDWLCPNCNFLNFARNLRCRECKEDGPRKLNVGRVEMKFGDWICPQCDFMNFANKRKCFRCLEPRPPRELDYGDWECPKCDFVNFRRNKVCLKCKFDQPEGVSKDHEWRHLEGSIGTSGGRANVWEDDGGDHFGVHRLGKRSQYLVRDSTDLGDDEHDYEDADILPLEGNRELLMTKRATPAERAFTASRNKKYNRVSSRDAYHVEKVDGSYV